MPTLSDIRERYPEYGDMSDADLSNALYKKFYSDMPREEFDKKLSTQQATDKPKEKEFSIPGEVKKVTSEIWEEGIAAPIGGFVDAANAALGAIGIPTSDKPVLGSEWLKQGMRTFGLSEAERPETLAGKIVGGALSGGSSALIGGGILGKGVGAAGGVLGNPAVKKTGEILAKPTANLIAGTGGGAGEATGRSLGKEVGLEGPAALTGELLGAALGGFASEATRVRPPRAPDPVISAYERLKLAPSAAESGLGGRAAQWIEGNVLPQTLGGGGVMENFKQRRRRELTSLQQQLANQLGGVEDRPDMGKTIQDSVQDTWNQVKKADGKIIGDLRQKYGNDPVYAYELVNAAANPVGAGTTAAVRESTVDPLSQKASEMIRETGGNFSFHDLADLKTAYGGALEPGFQKNVNDAQVEQLFNAARKDMENHIKSKSPNDLRMLQESRVRYAAAQDDFRKHFKKLLGTNNVPVAAERAYEIMTASASTKARGDIQEFKHVWDAMSPKARGDLSATILSRLGATDTNQPANWETWQLGKFLNGYRSLSDEAKGMLFGNNKQVQNGLDDLVTVTKNIQEKLQKLESTSKSGSARIILGQFGLGGVLGHSLVPGSPESVTAGILVGVGGPWLAAQMMTNPTAIKGIIATVRNVDRAIDSAVRATIDLNLIPKVQQVKQQTPAKTPQSPKFPELPLSQ